MNMQEMSAFITSSAASETRDSIKDLIELQKQQIQLLSQIIEVQREQRKLLEKKAKSK